MPINRVSRCADEGAFPNSSTRIANDSGVPSDPIRLAMNSWRRGIRDTEANLAALRTSTAANGSEAYQYMSGRLWSDASSEWLTNPDRISQRSSIGIRCDAEAR